MAIRDSHLTGDHSDTLRGVLLRDIYRRLQFIFTVHHRAQFIPAHSKDTTLFMMLLKKAEYGASLLNLSVQMMRALT